MSETDEQNPGKTSIFISHARQDSAVALDLAKQLRAAGYSPWCYEEHQNAGVSYLTQIAQAMKKAPIFLVLITRSSLASSQVTKELQSAYERGKDIMPVRYGISHEEFLQAASGAWEMAFPTSVSIEIAEGGVSAIVPGLSESIAELEAARGVVLPSPGRSPMFRELIRQAALSTWVLRVSYALLFLFSVYLAFGPNLIYGKCVIPEEDGGESPFRTGSVSIFVDGQEITVDINENGKWAVPLAAKFPIFGTELSFEEDDSKKRYPVEVGFLSILSGAEHRVRVDKRARPVFRLASAPPPEGSWFVSAAYAQEAPPSARSGGQVSTRGQTEIAQRVISVTAKTLKRSTGAILPESRLREDLKADSIDRSRLAAALESEFHVIFDAKDWERMETVSQIIGYVSAERKILDGFDRKVVEILKNSGFSRGERERLYFDSEIPGDKERTARHNARVPKDERIVALLDASLFQGAYEALLFGTQGLYFCTSFTASGPRFGFIEYADFPNREFKKKSFLEMSLGSGQYFVVLGSGFDGDELARALTRMTREVLARRYAQAPGEP